jgi:hypothetical protein
MTCSHGFCPESLCTCTERGPPHDLPPETPGVDVVATDPFDKDLNSLCQFACKYGYCPSTVCSTRVVEDEWEEEPEFPDFYTSEGFNKTAAREDNWKHCTIYKVPSWKTNEEEKAHCKQVCQDQIDEAIRDDRTTNWGCVGFFPPETGIPWVYDPPSGKEVTRGTCFCNNGIINEIVTDVMDALPALGQVRFFEPLLICRAILTYCTRLVAIS